MPVPSWPTPRCSASTRWRTATRWSSTSGSRCRPAPAKTRSAAALPLARVKSLLQHKDFSLRNPNRVRALLVSLCRDNPAAFHRADAAGYVFWAERLIELDAINPSLAGRLARVMDRWSHLAEPYRSAAREAIARVAARSDLSTEVREIVNRALENA